MSESEFNTIFSNKLKYYLYYYNITQAELARRLEVSSQSVTNWVNGVKSPRMKQIDKMCSIFSCNRSDLIEDKPIIPPTPPTPQLRSDEQQLLDGYNQLDQEDRAEVRGIVKGMLINKKYTKSSREKKA